MDGTLPGTSSIDHGQLPLQFSEAKNKRSEVWNYFLVDSTGKTVKCKKCSKIIYNVKNPSYLANHLWSHHRIKPGAPNKDTGITMNVTNILNNQEQ